MKTALSYILPVWKACEILGEDVVHRTVSSFLQLRRGGKKLDDVEQKKMDDDLDVLVRSLSYRHPPPNYPDTPIPPTVAQGWKMWASTPALQLDKSTLISWLVPANVRPFSGASGHQGLFDCWVYALQGHGVSASRSANVQVADALIFLAVCQQYNAFRQSQEGSSGDDGTDAVAPAPVAKGLDDSREDYSEAAAASNQPEVAVMARLVFRLYDSYQRKGVVARDTIHRFWTDVYGETLLQEYQDILTTLYSGDKSPQALVGENDFCRRVEEHGLFVVLDWMGRLARGLVPTPAIPLSTSAYLDTIRSQMTPPLPLCDMYALAEHRLYEIKRRFHSLTLSSKHVDVIQGDPMSEQAEATSSATEAAASGVSSTVTFRHYQAISEYAFCKAVSLPNSDLGHGGYLPQSLASLLFRAGGYMDPASTSGASVAVPSLSNGSAAPSQQPQPQYYWSLYQVLQFGCMAVRTNVVQSEGKNRALLRFVFRMFQLSAATNDEDDDEGDAMVLSRAQVAQAIVLLNEFADYRRSADSPVGDDDTSEVPSFLVNHDNLEDSLIEEESAIVLGLLPPKPSASTKAGYYKLSELVDHVLDKTVTPNAMSFDEFCTWEAAQVQGGPPSRCGFLMLELRLIAAVLFGIPPTEASMEVMLIGEIEGRHRERYPHSDVSRRGPRGTIWYLIDAEWLKQWATLVKKIANTPQNTEDMRGANKNDSADNTKARGLDRINNRGLLADDKSLNLRPDIRWKHDYEILPPLGWSALQAWYDGGPPIYRTVVRYVTSQPTSPHASVPSKRLPRIPTENELELYPLFVTVYLCDASSRGEARPFQQNYQLSRVSPVMVMLVQLCKELDVDPEWARLWVLENDPDMPATPAAAALKLEHDDWILSLDQNIIEQRKRRASPSEQGKGITLLLELKDRDTGKWPRGVDGKEWTFKEKNQTKETRSDVGDGIVGLYNMGYVREIWKKVSIHVCDCTNPVLPFAAIRATSTLPYNASATRQYFESILLPKPI